MSADDHSSSGSTPPESSAPSDADTRTPAQTVIKGYCQDCTFYRKCPRMRGKNVCYGGKGPLPPPSPTP